MPEEKTTWPFQEAQKINLEKLGPQQPLVFQTGFGPSGRPHIGTFAEVARTIMVQNAFTHLHPERPTRLFVFCDDMDGLRRAPGNMPNQEMLKERIGMPLHKIPDPFGTDESYSAHMERELVEFLSRFGFEFELKSSAAEYRSGVFNRGLHLVLDHYDEIRDLILPTLQEENRESWSPLIPACQSCGRVYTTVVTGFDPEGDTVAYKCTGSFGRGEDKARGCGREGEVSVKEGSVKAGWKIDWALRWFTYQVGYEMYGKDLIDSARLSARVLRILGGEPPAGMVYEMFLDESGKKISKSVGEGLTVDAWMDYAPIESLLHYLFLNPRKQRRLHFDVIPKSVDDLLRELKAYPGLDEKEKPGSVVWHLERIGRPAAPYTASVNYSLILNLISAMGTGDRELIREYVMRYDPEAANNPEVVDAMLERAERFFLDFIEPSKRYRPPSPEERPLFQAILAKLEAYEGTDEAGLQAIPFDVAREHGADPKKLFASVYQVLLGQDRGPRFGTFAALVGKERAADMIRSKIS